MDIKLARSELNKKAKAIDLKKIEQMISKDGSSILYLDRENTHKDLLALQEHFEQSGKNFYMREVRFGLSDDEYAYEIHIL